MSKRIKVDLVSYPARAERLGKYDNLGKMFTINFGKKIFTINFYHKFE